MNADIEDIVTVYTHEFMEEQRMNTLTIKGDFLTNKTGVHPGNQKPPALMHPPAQNQNPVTGGDGIRMIGDQAYRVKDGQMTAIGQEWNRTQGPANMRFTDPVSASNQAGLTASEKKKLSYCYKKIASLIRTSETLTSAKSAVSKAKAEVGNLKKKRGSDKYDQNELEMAINHAMAMERIAIKHKKNIETEEFAKRGICSNCSMLSPQALEDAKKESEDNERERMTLSEEACASSTMAELIQEDGAANQEDLHTASVMTEEDVAAFTKDIGKYMIEEAASLEAFAEGELMDMMQDLLAYSDDFDENDMKKMVLRHRSSEEREITKANMQYMKDYIDYIQGSAGNEAKVAMSCILC
jgi:hypothetical protein